MDLTLTNDAELRAAQRLTMQSDFDLLLRYADQGGHDMVVKNKSVMQAELDAIEARPNADRLRRMKGVHIALGSKGEAITPRSSHCISEFPQGVVAPRLICRVDTEAFRRAIGLVVRHSILRSGCA